jgi:flagellar motor switch protein FliN/FliY
MSAVEQIDIELTVVVGMASLPLTRFLKLGRGAVIQLGRDIASPVVILANGKSVARGRVKICGDRVAVEIAP